MLNNSQFIKLFDRRFVANTVRNSCRCPKCRSEYSYNYDVADKYGKDQFILSNRPVLLPCGHNMCENCVYHNRQNLTCTTCLKPIEISLDLDPTQEVKFNVRDHFDMNFYLMGELNTLRQHRNTFSSNNSMSGTNRDAGGGATSSVIKCIECELVPSIGKCRQCKVYLCKRCFDAVHKNSKVLKMHTMQRYDHDKNKSNVMRFMKPQYCKRHQNIINRYCTKCDLFCCYDCAKNDHAQHKWTTLLEENNKLMPDISETLEVIQTSRENLKKGQKDIKSVEIQLEEYASKTMEDISNYFLQLHSFLQNEEREITEKFSEMCQQPQLNLREANIKLNESQEKLNSMRANLEYYQHKPPTDFHLGKLLKVYCEQLQDVPNNIQITKPRSNPFHFEIKQDIRQDIRKYYEYTYNDPTILFKMDVSSESAPSLADSTTLSSINRTSNTTDTNYQQQQKPQQKFKNKSKNNKKPQKKKQANNPLPIANKPPISDDDISLPSRGRESFAASAQKPQSSTSEENTVRVTYIKSPEQFYVQNVNDVQKIRELSHSYLTGALGNRIPEVISEGYYYMAYHTTDRQWYRGMLKKIVNDEVYKIFLVDFGMHLEVSKEKLCDIDKKHLKIPFAAIRCAIYDIMPVGNQWTEVANGLLVELLQNSPARMSIIEKINDEMLKIDLQTVHTKSVRDSFLYTGLARERPGVFSFKMQIKTAFPTTKIEDRIPKNIINMTDMICVTVLNIEGPQEFYVIKNELIDCKKQFVKDLNEFYATAQSDKLQQIYLATTQMCCVIYLKDIWHRAVIEEINYKGQLTVRLVDEGRCELINWRQAFVLNTKFRKTSEFSIRCSLADLEPLQENGYIYTQTAIQDFKQMCTNPLLKMELQAIKQNEYKVILYISKKKMDINIGAALVRNKHGISTGVATQVTEYAKTPNPRLSLPPNLSNETLTTALQLHIHSPKPSQVTMSDNLSFAKNRELVNPTQSSATSSKQPQQPTQAIKILKRTLIEIAHYINPGEFYIQLASLSRGTKRFHQNIQDAQAKKYPADQLPPPQENREWFMENHCLVYTKYYSSKVVINPNDIPLADCEWYRGIITNIHYLPGEEPKFSVFLRDIGATICSIVSQQLFSIDPQLDRVTNAVYRCHLACIEPAAGGKIWSGASIDDFLSMTSKFETLSVTLQGKRCPERNSLPIVLWGSKTETTDPLAPCTTKYSNVNRALVRHGLAYVVDRLDVTQQFDQIEEMECAEGEISLEEWFKAFSDNALLKVIERNELELPSILRKSGVSAADDNLNFPDTEDNPLNIHLTEFDYKYTTNQNAPTAWLTSKVITKTIFTGIPTYIDFDCMVYLYEADDKDFLLKLSKEINKTYGNLPPPSADYVYKIGQPCLTKYHLDQKFYRGIVKELNGPNELSIQFVDYGNIELVETKDVRPYAPYPNLPALVNKYIIDGIKPKGGATAYDVNDLDQMHKLIVTKFVSVRIPVSELSNTIKRCCLRIGNMDMACEFIERGLAEADYATYTAAATSASSGNTSFKMRKNLNPIPSEPPVEDYDVFNQDINMSIQHLHHLVIDEEDDDDDVDEVAEDTLLVDTDDDDTKFDHLNEMMQRLDKNTNLAHQLLTKATTTGGTISTTTTTGLNTQPPPPKKRMFNDKDYTQMMSGMAYDSDNMNENFDDDGLDDKAFCVDYDDCDDDVVELEAKLDLNYWHGVGEDMLEEEEKEISQQLETRASYQEERDIESEFDGFHPNETSTVFSHFSGIEFFKMPQLPAAMHHFKCRVNSMLTATVLQIFPHHTEFRYREVELQRQIKQLVKSAPMLAQFEPRTICLARYTMDKRWYRALIRSYNPAAKTVDVLYADYMNSETLPVKYIRQCPADLLGWPLRTFRVRLHGIKPNPNIKDHEIRVALYKLLAKRTLFAVVKKHPNNRGSVQGLDAISSSLANNDLMEVALYESQEVSLKGITIYEPLIVNQYFQRI